MKRLIAFLSAVICAAGAMVFSASALVKKSDDLIFTEIVRYGDPAVLDGRVIESGIQCGEHMEWRTVYTFAGENSYDTEFIFTQKVEREQETERRAYMEAYVTNGMGGSTSGEMTLRNTGYGEMVRAVAAVTSAGETKEMNLKLRDYVQYHALTLDINYVTDAAYCSEMVDIFDHIMNRWDDDQMDFEQWLLQNANYCYSDFVELFRFPVQEDEIVNVSATRDHVGNLVSMGYNNLNGPEISVICALNDQGAYCIPVFRKDDQPLQGEYRDGMGLYFIPWREVPGSDRYVLQGQERKRIPTVTLDVDRAENILPMDDLAIVYGLEVDEGSGFARMISLEGDTYYLTEIDLAAGEIKNRLAVLEKEPDAEYCWPNWEIQGELMILEASDYLALVTLGDAPVLEFAIPLGEAKNGYWDVRDDCGAIHYDGEKLILVGARGFHDDRSLEVQVFDKTGPLFWGEYTCSIFACNDPGASPYIHNREKTVVIR